MLNRIVLMGRMVADPELKTTPNGVSVATFRLAVERNYAEKGKQREADFIPCVAWRQTGEFIASYFPKGRLLLVEGGLQTRNYEDKTGQKRTAFEVVVDRAYFTGEKASGPEEKADEDDMPAGTAKDWGSPPPMTDDGDLPF